MSWLLSPTSYPNINSFVIGDANVSRSNLLRYHKVFKLNQLSADNFLVFVTDLSRRSLFSFMNIYPI